MAEYLMLGIYRRVIEGFKVGEIDAGSVLDKIVNQGKNLSLEKAHIRRVTE